MQRCECCAVSSNARLIAASHCSILLLPCTPICHVPQRSVPWGFQGVHIDRMAFLGVCIVPKRFHRAHFYCMCPPKASSTGGFQGGHLDKGSISECMQQVRVGEQQRLCRAQDEVLGRAVDAGQFQPRWRVVGVEQRDSGQARRLIRPPPSWLGQRVGVHHCPVQAVHSLHDKIKRFGADMKGAQAA